MRLDCPPQSTSNHLDGLWRIFIWGRLTGSEGSPAENMVETVRQRVLTAIGQEPDPDSAAQLVSQQFKSTKMLMKLAREEGRRARGRVSIQFVKTEDELELKSWEGHFAIDPDAPAGSFVISLSS